MKLNGKRYSLDTVINNIKRVYDATSSHDRYCWYTEANNYAIELSNSSGLSLAQCCGIIAAFSPLKSWSENKRIARAFISHGIVEGLHTSLFIGKAKDVRHWQKSDGNQVDYILGVLKGEKIKSFFLNILSPECCDNVTIDRHAFSIAVGYKLTDVKTKLSKSQYIFVKTAYIEAAKQLNISPVRLQSSTWLLWRRNGQIKLL